MKTINLVLLLNIFCLLSCQTKETHQELNKKDIFEKYLMNGAFQFSYLHPNYQIYLDSALVHYPNEAFLWQQKSMPLFKQKKYELGMPYLNKAVELDKERYLPYRAFIKCIFQKDYSGSIKDLQLSKEIDENGYVMDHTYNFYIGLSYLQLNELDNAKKHIEESISYQTKQFGTDYVHFLDIFYLGIIELEKQDYIKAIEFFDQSLTSYPNFSDAQYYKALCEFYLGRKEEAVELIKTAKSNFEVGYSMTEDNSAYEDYPYQIKKWSFMHIESLIEQK